MKIYLHGLTYLMSQALPIARMSTEDEDIRRSIKSWQNYRGWNLEIPYWIRIHFNVTEYIVVI